MRKTINGLTYDSEAGRIYYCVENRPNWRPRHSTSDYLLRTSRKSTYFLYRHDAYGRLSALLYLNNRSTQS